MTIPFATGQPPAVLYHCRSMLAAHLPSYLTAYQTGLDSASGVPLDLPVPAEVYLGTVEDRQGVYPAVGLLLESTRPRPLVTPEYLLEHQLAVTVALHAGRLGAVDPSQVYTTAQAYVAAVCECLSTTVPRFGVGLGIYDARTVSCEASRSPHVVYTDPETHYETRRALGRVTILQTLRREVPL